MIQKALVTFALVVSLLGLAGLQFLIRDRIDFDQKKEFPEKFVGLNINPKVVRNLLGVRILVADLIWLDALIKADTKRFKDPFTPLYKTVRNIVALDPDNVMAYYVGGMYLSVIKDDVLGAKEILGLGSRYVQEQLKNSFRSSPRIDRFAGLLYFSHGYNLIFEVHEFDEGSYWIEQAGNLESSPAPVKRLAKKVSDPKGRLDIASKVLGDMLSRTKDEGKRKRIQEKMLDIAVRRELTELNEGFEKFIKETEAEHLPRKRIFDLYMRSIGHSRRDILERPLKLNENGLIESKVTN